MDFIFEWQEQYLTIETAGTREKGAFLLANLNLYSSIKNWVRLLKFECGSVLTRKSLGRGYLEVTFDHKSIDQMERIIQNQFKIPV